MARKMISCVDYTLKRRSVLRDLRAGRISSYDACDAHPEITRIARLSGVETTRSCPICGKSWLKHLHFVYGDELGELSGRLLPVDTIWNKLPEEYASFVCYVVEVCVDCSWNHMVRSYHFQNAAPDEKEARRVSDV
jgi:hypothetical protein